MNSPIPENKLDDYSFSEPIHVSQPTLPPLEEYTRELERVWENRWLTNNGESHVALERRMKEYLEVEHISLFCNGTIALLVALQTLNIRDGEVITTPFTFPATPHSLHWNRIRPVFSDIDPITYNLDPSKIEAQITPATKAILPVHVYGTPCDIDGIKTVADRHGLPVIYDAAHAMGVRHKNRALADYGELSILSFHATKLFTTAEGGALVSHSAEAEQNIYYLKNFGISGEESVESPGINGKMNELQAALGLTTLGLVDPEIALRKNLTQEYRNRLGNLPGITLLEDAPDTKPNYAYFPVRIDENLFGLNRDAVNDALRTINVFPRKYFYPLCSDYECYSEQAASANLEIAKRVSEQILCLPLHGHLSAGDIEKICGALIAVHEMAQDR
jgi:dTDP-4-amino-4,6-dideoxygalactose transaminase